MDRGNARSIDLCLSALALSPWSWPHPHGRTPTIPPVFSNARRLMTRHQPLRGRGILPPDKRTPRERARGGCHDDRECVIHGRNHAGPITHLISLENPADCRRRVAKSPIVKALPSRGRDACLEFGHEDRTADVLTLFCNALPRGCARYLFLVSQEAIDQSWPQHRIEVSRSREGSRQVPKGLQMRLDYDLQAV
jgi:hypothetical protein